MDALFHFIFPIIAALAARVHIKHPIRNILIAGFLALLIDLDHFIGVGYDRALFHNIFITILIPAVLLYLSFRFKTSKYTKGFFVLLLIFLSSAMFLDMFTEAPGIALFFPLDTTYYSLSFCLPVQIVSAFATEACLVSSYGIGLFLFFLIILIPSYYIDEIIEHPKRKRKR